VGTSGDDPPALIKFSQITLGNFKNKNISLYLRATRAKQLLPALTVIVNIRALSNQNILVSSKTFPKN